MQPIDHPEEKQRPDNPARRRLIQAIAATTSAALASNIRIREWSKPVIEVGILPARANLSTARDHGSGNYALTQTGLRDGANHKPSIEKDAPVVDGRTVLVLIHPSETGNYLSFFVNGESPFVPVSGIVTQEGSGQNSSNPVMMNGSGTGTVAGFPNTSVALNGTIDAENGRIAGTYRMGVGGNLPTGQSFDVDFAGERL